MCNTVRGRVTTALGVLALLGAVTTRPALAADDARLIEAVRNGSREAVAALLRERVNVNAPQADGATALHWAAHRDDGALVEMLVAAGANVNARNDLGATPLWLAASQGSSAMVGRLLGAGANPNLALEEGETPLLAAARAGANDAVRQLVARGADVNATEKLRGQSALMWAAASNRPDVVRTLVELGATVGARSAERTMVVNTGIQTGGGGRGVDERYAPPGTYDHKEGGYTPLLFAAVRGSTESLEVLVAAGADVNDTAANGASALALAVHSGHTATARRLIELGADVNAAGAGYAPLHAAVLRADLDSATALLARGANPNAPLEKGTPIRRSSTDWAFNHTWIGTTPYWLAARFADASMMRLLANAGADPRVAAPDGTTTVMAAAGLGFGGDRRFRGVGTVTTLPDDEGAAARATSLAIELGADVNAASPATGDTALHAAVARRFQAVIRVLVAHGAALDARNKKGMTPLALVQAAPGAAPDEARDAVAALLRSLGASQ